MSRSTRSSILLSGTISKMMISDLRLKSRCLAQRAATGLSFLQDQTSGLGKVQEAREQPVSEAHITQTKALSGKGVTDEGYETDEGVGRTEFT